MKHKPAFVMHDFPQNVRLALKQLAIQANKSLRQYVIDLLTKHVSQK